MSVIEEPQTETYKCDYCGSTFRHHQLFEGEVIKCPSCGSHSVKIVQKIEVRVSPQGDLDYEEETTISPFGLSLSTILILFSISIFIGLGMNWSIISQAFNIQGVPSSVWILLPLVFVLAFLIGIIEVLRRI